MQVREDFRRDGLAATFLVGAELFAVLASAFPSGTRFNIGYPSICEEETRACARILTKKPAHQEYCVVGHARQFDLDVMASLLKGYQGVSANIWLPSSQISARRILNSTPDQILEKAIGNINYWKSISDAPMDIALTDVTAHETGVFERVIEWVPILKAAGYRDVILCDTKGQANLSLLPQLFEKLDRFEWHPHNDNHLALSTSLLAIQHGKARIGTSILSCSERMNMLDPRMIPGLAIDAQGIDTFTRAYRNQFGRPLEKVRDGIYGHNMVVTGTHHLLWGGKGTELIFGVTTNTLLASEMLEHPINAEELRALKNELLYRGKRFSLSREEFKRLAKEAVVFKHAH